MSSNPPGSGSGDNDRPDSEPIPTRTITRKTGADLFEWTATEPTSPNELERAIAERRDKAPATLTTLMGNNFGKRYRLGDETLIGRASGCTIRLTAPDASRHHARIVREADGRFTLHDLGSHNGTRVDGQRINTHELQGGDRVAIGAETVFLFSLRSPEEEEVVEVQKMESMGQLAGGIAHDFNNLLAAILGNTELALQAIDAPEVDSDLAQECLEDVLGAANRAQDLVQQLLGFARRGNWEEAPADVAAVVQEVLQLLSRTFDPNIEIDVQTDEGLYVIGDRSQLFQMIMNLCLNSRDAMGEGGRLTVSAQLTDAPRIKNTARELGQQVLISVSDTGHGMDVETQERIFEPFFTTKERGRGSGLGLAVVYGIVASHGGRIWVTSEPGEGTSFHVALPALEEAPPSATDEQTTVIPGILSETRHSGRDLMLIIDDEAMVRRGLRRMVQSLGFNAVEAEDGPAGIEEFRQNRERISVVVLDLVMPGMGGEEVLAVLLGIDPDAVVLVVSGYHDDAKINSLERAGAAWFLPKPFTRGQLRYSLEAALTRGLAVE